MAPGPTVVRKISVYWDTRAQRFQEPLVTGALRLPPWSRGAALHPRWAAGRGRPPWSQRSQWEGAAAAGRGRVKGGSAPRCSDFRAARGVCAWGPAGSHPMPAKEPGEPAVCLGESQAAEEHAATDGTEGVAALGGGATYSFWAHFSFPWGAPSPTLSVSVLTFSRECTLTRSARGPGGPKSLGLAGSPFSYSSPRGGSRRPAPSSSLEAWRARR